MVEDYDGRHKITFDTKVLAKYKTKSMIFTDKPAVEFPEPLSFNMQKLPWVYRTVYLGTVFTQIPNVLAKKYDYMQSTLPQKLGSSHPELLINIHRIYI